MYVIHTSLHGKGLSRFVCTLRVRPLFMLSRQPVIKFSRYFQPPLKVIYRRVHADREGLYAGFSVQQASDLLLAVTLLSYFQLVPISRIFRATVYEDLLFGLRLSRKVPVRYLITGHNHFISPPFQPIIYK
jgi:hypothetical protein